MSRNRLTDWLTHLLVGLVVSFLPVDGKRKGVTSLFVHIHKLQKTESKSLLLKICNIINIVDVIDNNNNNNNVDIDIVYIDINNINDIN